MENTRKNWCIKIIIVIALSLAIRLIGMKFVSQDMKVFLLDWYEEISHMGLKEALTTQVGNYNKPYQFIIFLLTRFPGSVVVKYKIISIIFDYCMAVAVFFLLKECVTEKTAFIGATIVLFLPTVWLNSAFWGQCDSIYVSFIIWALYFFIKKKDVYGFAFFGISLAFKLQAIFFLPFVGLYLLKRFKEKKIVLLYPLISLLAYFVMSLPSVIAQKSFAGLISVYVEQTDTYRNVSLNFSSFWNLFNFTYDQMSLWAIVLAFVFVGVAVIVLLVKKIELTNRVMLWLGFLLSYSCVFFLPAMHDRYGYLYEILGLALVLTLQRGYVFYSLLEYISLRTYTYYLVQHFYYYKILVILNIIIFVVAWIAFICDMKIGITPVSLFQKKEADEIENNRIGEEKFQATRRDIFSMLALSLIFLIVAGVGLGSKKVPDTCVEMTDEINQVEVFFDKAEKVRYVDVYMKMATPINVKIYIEQEGDWYQIDDTTELKSVFGWNQIYVGDTTNHLCVEFPETTNEICEIVCLNEKGEVIPAVEIGDGYNDLFDEQDCVDGVPCYYDGTMFDEVYHARTAYEFVHGLKIYEISHPPLGKILISLGVRVFGMTPLGYRCIPLLFGTIMIPMMYLFALRLFRRYEYALLAGILILTGFMHFTLSRIATIDIIVAAFVIGLFYCIFAFYQEKKDKYLWLGGLFAAFGVATKWTAVYALAGAAIILFVHLVCLVREKEDTQKAKKIFKFILICIISFIAIPSVVYVLSYIPFAKVNPEKNILQHAISNSISMFNYHKNVDQNHPYASKWYLWLIDWVPLLDSRTQYADRLSCIATFLNPFICFTGLISVVHNLFLAIKRKNQQSIVILVMYFSMLLPWLFITRTVFIYQYFIPAVLLILLICQSIHEMNYLHEKKILICCGCISVVLFVCFFPIISGHEVSLDYVKNYLYLLPRWRY